MVSKILIILSVTEKYGRKVVLEMSHTLAILVLVFHYTR